MNFKKSLALASICLLILNCSHSLRITNAEELNVSSSFPLQNQLRIGLSSPQMDDYATKKYIESVADALSRNSSVSRVVYPYKASLHASQVDVVIDLSVTTKYDGKWSNFFINWPGFLIWAPAVWGYGYKADIETKGNISFTKKKANDSFTLPLVVHFRQAEIDRTWTEISWFEITAIAFVGGFYMTTYDDDLTPEFITKFTPQYSQLVVNRILKSLESN
ncbi:hypothetical protein [Leptospira kanakyensis]|uniref:hypothetical protein n=1 Tax=Leptospira kanakyensis TaxID=2484968 RepID=UPI00223CCFCD|nr:hypothetical protein [Leptospira kanakyensis]MCW7469833.1 hypothetical protein [Leptospira kanakyensis]